MTARLLVGVQYRWNVYKNIRAHIENAEGGMDKFTQAYKHFGLNRGEHEGQQGIWRASIPPLHSTSHPCLLHMCQNVSLITNAHRDVLNGECPWL